jgi:uncharacterized protein YjbJ (UPF0337 family)
MTRREDDLDTRGSELEVEGKLQRGRGTARSTFGKLTGSEEQRAKGGMDSFIGRLKENAGGAMRGLRRLFGGDANDRGVQRR